MWGLCVLCFLPVASGIDFLDGGPGSVHHPIQYGNQQLSSTAGESRHAAMSWNIARGAYDVELCHEYVGCFF